jgi:NADPH:quinone reductase-like Zn-dependent oxidoreductase
MRTSSGSLGAVAVIDYTTIDVAALGGVFDVVLDAVGTTSRRKTAAALAPGGRFVSVNQGMPVFTRESTC